MMVLFSRFSVVVIIVVVVAIPFRRRDSVDNKFMRFLVENESECGIKLHYVWMTADSQVGLHLFAERFLAKIRIRITAPITAKHVCFDRHWTRSRRIGWPWQSRKIGGNLCAENSSRDATSKFHQLSTTKFCTKILFTFSFRHQRRYKGTAQLVAVEIRKRSSNGIVPIAKEACREKNNQKWAK